MQEQEEQLQENVLDLEEHLQQEEVQVQGVRHRRGGISGLGRAEKYKNYMPR